MRLLNAVLLAILLSACAPSVVVITATPAPSPSAVPTAQPTEQSNNPHLDCLLARSSEDCAVNSNAHFVAPYALQSRHDDKFAYAPRDWSFIRRQGNSPVLPNVACADGDCVISMDSLSGFIGWQSAPFVVYPMRYLVIVRYTFWCNSPLADRFTVRTSAVLSSPDSSAALVEQSLKVTSGYQENLWVIESRRQQSNVRLELLQFVPFGICGQGSALSVHSIEVLPVMPSYGGSSAVLF